MQARWVTHQLKERSDSVEQALDLDAVDVGGVGLGGVRALVVTEGQETLRAMLHRRFIIQSSKGVTCLFTGKGQSSVCHDSATEILWQGKKHNGSERTPRLLEGNQ